MNWTIAATIAQLVAAVALIVSAVALFLSADDTKSVADKTGELAKATQDIVDRADKELAESLQLVEASNRQAEATNDLVREAREERGLAWRPVLSLAKEPWRSDNQPAWSTHRRQVASSFGLGKPGPARVAVEVRNAGSGPALGCVAVMTPEPEWCAFMRVGDVKAGSEEAGGATETKVTVDYYLPLLLAPEKELNAQGAAGGPPTSVAIFCRDVFGNRYRFPVLWFGPDDLRTFDAEIYDPKSGNKTPAWVWDHRLWPV